MLGYLIGLGGMWIMSDGIYSWSLYKNASTYGSNCKQTFWRDHWVRLARILWGIFFMIAGAVIS